MEGGSWVNGGRHTEDRRTKRLHVALKGMALPEAPADLRARLTQIPHSTQEVGEMAEDTLTTIDDRRSARRRRYVVFVARPAAQR